MENPYIFYTDDWFNGSIAGLHPADSSSILLSSTMNANRERIRKYKLKAVKKKGGECEHCGYSKHQEVLTFHHRDGEIKIKKMASFFESHSWSKIKEELDKCDMLCANCHIEEHVRRGDMGINHKYK